jgi:hypothetical protein
MFYGWKFTSGGQCGWAWGDRASQLSERKLLLLKEIVYSRSTHEKPQEVWQGFLCYSWFLDDILQILRYFMADIFRVHCYKDWCKILTYMVDVAGPHNRADGIFQHVYFFTNCGHFQHIPISTVEFSNIFQQEYMNFPIYFFTHCAILQHYTTYKAELPLCWFLA